MREVHVLVVDQREQDCCCLFVGRLEQLCKGFLDQRHELFMSDHIEKVQAHFPAHGARLFQSFDVHLLRFQQEFLASCFPMQAMIPDASSVIDPQLQLPALKNLTLWL